MSRTRSADLTPDRGRPGLPGEADAVRCCLDEGVEFTSGLYAGYPNRSYYRTRNERADSCGALFSRLINVASGRAARRCCLNSGPQRGRWLHDCLSCREHG